jgi:hypothetical protein
MDPLVAEHLEVLRRAEVLRVGIVEGVDSTDSFDRLLGDAVTCLARQ